jgi:hypothetical protein
MEKSMGLGKRAYSVSDWQRDFARAFAASVPLEAAPTQARGALLAAENDEDEPRTFRDLNERINAEVVRPILRHSITRDRTGTGLSDSVRVKCSCGWAGPERFEFQDDMSAGLRADEAAHLAAPGVDRG